jgi:hypothetical protein
MNENVISSNNENDLSNLMNENVISLNLTKTIHQIWWRRLIKILKKETIFLLFDE